MIFGPQQEEKAGSWSKLLNEVLNRKRLIVERTIARHKI
jgi:hypothetical protein